MHDLDTATGKLSTTDHDLWHLAGGMEGTTITLNGGYYYLFGSKGTCCSGTNSTYYTVVGGSTGRYVDQAGVALTAGALERGRLATVIAGWLVRHHPDLWPRGVRFSPGPIR